MSKSEVERRAYEAREASLHYEATIKQGYFRLGKEEGIELGKEEGIGLGKEEADLRTVRNALNKGYSPEAISEITGIPLYEVKRLISL